MKTFQNTVYASLAVLTLSAPMSSAFAETALSDDRFLVGAVESGLEVAEMQYGDTTSEIGIYTINSQVAQADVDDVNDPLEGLNRAIFAFNDVFYSYLLGPVAEAYNVLPVEARTVVGSFLSNLRGPVVFFNDLLQGEFERAGTTLVRFGINSTVGFAGMADVASSFGYEKHTEDFGQTLAVWGTGEGFYLVLPFLGPSNPRDAVGQYVVDPLMDPFTIYLDNTDQEEWTYGRIGATAVHEFASVKGELEELKRTSVDFYAAVRSLYRQRRAADIANGETTNVPTIPDFDLGLDDFDPEAPSVAQTDEQAALPTSEAAYSVDDPLAVKFVPATNDGQGAGR